MPFSRASYSRRQHLGKSYIPLACLQRKVFPPKKYFLHVLAENWIAPLQIKTRFFIDPINGFEGPDPQLCIPSPSLREAARLRKKPKKV